MTDQTTKYLGIDIGGTSAKYALITSAGEISRKGSFSTGSEIGLDLFLNSLCQVIDASRQENIKGIGISCLGIINSQTGEIMGGVANMPYLAGLNLKQLLIAKYPDIPVSISNDVKAAVRGEQWLGAARDCQNVFFVSLGTGLGGSLMLNSQVVEGSHHRAGEICYLDFYNDQDYYEKYASTQHVMAIAARKLGLQHMDGFEFFRRIRQGDWRCDEILDQWVINLARLIANIIIIFDVEKVIIGGGVSSERDILVPRINQAVNKMIPPEFRNQTVIETALCANDAGIMGAVRPLLKN